MVEDINQLIVPQKEDKLKDIMNDLMKHVRNLEKKNEQLQRVSAICDEVARTQQISIVRKRRPLNNSRFCCSNIIKIYRNFRKDSMTSLSLLPFKHPLHLLVELKALQS